MYTIVNLSKKYVNVDGFKSNSLEAVDEVC